MEDEEGSGGEGEGGGHFGPICGVLSCVARGRRVEGNLVKLVDYGGEVVGEERCGWSQAAKVRRDRVVPSSSLSFEATGVKPAAEELQL